MLPYLRTITHVICWITPRFETIAESYQKLLICGAGAHFKCGMFRRVRLSQLVLNTSTRNLEERLRRQVCVVIQIGPPRKLIVVGWLWLWLLRWHGWLIYLDRRVSGSRWIWRNRDTLLLVPVGSVSFLARQWPYLSSGSCFSVVESLEVRINITVLIPHRKEVSSQGPSWLRLCHWREEFPPCRTMTWPTCLV